jgi:tetratricopeptide (TPR) repeat protein
LEPIVAPAAPGRKWLFRLLAAVVLPLLALAGVEGVLRLAGYGYPTGFFLPARIGGRDFLVENDRFGYRFFPPDIARTPPSLRIPARKPAGAFRVFILGESAALGDPAPAFGVGRYLEVLLRDRYPDMHLEVINVAMTAINSYAIVPIARDCARREGDLWIVYMGNNEMVGPFGAATVFGARTPPRALVRLGLAIQTTRLGQLLGALARQVARHGSSPKSWGGLEMFMRNEVPPDDPRRQAVYRDFAENLRDILQAGLDSGASVLLSTVAVNLKDCPPFGSQVTSNLALPDRNRVEQLLARGNHWAAQGRSTEAAASYEEAARLRPQCAELEYRLGRCLLESTNPAAARAHFERAVDFDCLPFRADTGINNAIAAAARRWGSSRLVLFNAVAALAAGTRGDVPGEERFYEHVHLNFDGNYLLARAWAEAVAGLLPSGIRPRAGSAWASQEVCERQLGVTDWDRYNVLNLIYRRLQQPPWSGQLDNAQRVRQYADRLEQLRARMNGGARVQARDIYLEAVKAAPEDFYLRENFADFLEDTGDIPAAMEQWRKVSELIPQDPAADFNLGRLAARQGDFADARLRLTRTVVAHPGFAPGWFELGKVNAEQRDYAAALEDFGRVLKYEPRDASAWFYSGLTLAMLGRRAEAIQHYRQAVGLDPDDWKAHYELGGLLGQDGDMAGARAESAAAVRLNPDFPVARLNLGRALVQLGQLDEAEQQFEEVLRLDPTNSRAADYLSQTRALQKERRRP